MNQLQIKNAKLLKRLLKHNYLIDEVKAMQQIELKPSAMGFRQGKGFRGDTIYVIPE